MANYSGTVLADMYDDYDGAIKKYEGLPFVGLFFFFVCFYDYFTPNCNLQPIINHT